MALPGRRRRAPEMTNSKSDDHRHLWPIELAAIREFLARWQLDVSASGFLRVQPSGPRLEPAELVELIRRMRAAYTDDYPAVIVFDFSAVAMCNSDASEIRRLLQAFATDIPGRMVVTSPAGGRLTVAVVRRPEGCVPETVSSEAGTAASTAD